MATDRLRGLDRRASHATGVGPPALTAYRLWLSSALALLAIGLTMVFSASSVSSFKLSGSFFTIVDRQVLWAAVGLLAMVVGSRCSEAAIRRMVYPLLACSMLGLFAVMVPGLGSPAQGASRWLSVGGNVLRFQPSELAKLALVLWSADVLSRKQRLLSQGKHLLIPVLPVVLLAAALVIVEPDLGTAMVITATVLGLLFFAGAPARIMCRLGAGFVGATGLLAVLAPYRLARLTSFVHPFADASGSGYQAVQGLYALAGGGWWGVGLGASRQKWFYLPNAYTDYIYAILGEELGLVGTLAVLALYATFAYAGLLAATRAPTLFGRLIAAGVTTWLLVQAVLNMGAVTGVLPITGIPLPLLSFGGSSLAVTLFAIGLVSSVARPRPGRLTRPADGRTAVAIRGASRARKIWREQPHSGAQRSRPGPAAAAQARVMPGRPRLR